MVPASSLLPSFRCVSVLSRRHSVFPEGLDINKTGVIIIRIKNYNPVEGGAGFEPSCLPPVLTAAHPHVLPTHIDSSVIANQSADWCGNLLLLWGFPRRCAPRNDI